MSFVDYAHLYYYLLVIFYVSFVIHFYPVYLALIQPLPLSASLHSLSLSISFYLHHSLALFISFYLSIFFLPLSHLSLVLFISLSWSFYLYPSLSLSLYTYKYFYLTLFPYLTMFHNVYTALTIPVDCINNLQSDTVIVVNPIPHEICQFVITDKHWLIENVLCLLSNATKYSTCKSIFARILCSFKSYSSTFISLVSTP